MNQQLCIYGCGNLAKYQLKNGNWICSKSWSSCPANKKKNSEGVSLAYKENRKSYTYNSNSAWKNNKNSNGFKEWKEDILTKGFIDNFSGGYDIRKFYIKNVISVYSCSICEIQSWNNNIINLEMDHINGSHNDNRLENLRLLCPNCHSQTDTYCGKNINNGNKKISDEELIKLIESSKSIHEVLLKAGLAPKGGNYDRIKKLIFTYELKMFG